MVLLQDNLPAYLEAQLRYRMMNRIKAQLLEFLKVIILYLLLSLSNDSYNCRAINASIYIFL